MTRRVTDRAVLRCLKQGGVDVESIRAAIATGGRRPAICVEIDENGLSHGDGVRLQDRRVAVPVEAVFIGVRTRP